MVSTFRFILFGVYSFVLKVYELKPSAEGSETPDKTTHSSEPSFQDMQIEKGRLQDGCPHYRPSYALLRLL